MGEGDSDCTYRHRGRSSRWLPADGTKGEFTAFSHDGTATDLICTGPEPCYALVALETTKLCSNLVYCVFYASLVSGTVALP